MTFSVRTWCFIVRFVKPKRVTQENFANKTEILDFTRSWQYAVKPFILSLLFKVIIQKHSTECRQSFAVPFGGIRKANLP